MVSVAESNQFRARGVVIIVGAFSFVSLSLGFVHMIRTELIDPDSELNPISNFPTGALLLVGLTAIAIGFMYAAVRLPMSGVFLNENEFVVRQIARTRRVERSRLIRARVDIRLLSKVTLDLVDGDEMRFELYAKYKLPKYRAIVVEAINDWAGGESCEDP